MKQQSIIGIDGAIVRTREQASSVQRAESGRKAILGGCIIAMMGVVSYCFVALGGSPDADVRSTLFDNGIFGWTAFIFLLVGVGMWVSGNIALLNEAENARSGR